MGNENKKKQTEQTNYWLLAGVYLKRSDTNNKNRTKSWSAHILFDGLMIQGDVKPKHISKSQYKRFSRACAMVTK